MAAEGMESSKSENKLAAKIRRDDGYPHPHDVTIIASIANPASRTRMLKVMYGDAETHPVFVAARTAVEERLAAQPVCPPLRIFTNEWREKLKTDLDVSDRVMGHLVSAGAPDFVEVMNDLEPMCADESKGGTLCKDLNKVWEQVKEGRDGERGNDVLVYTDRKPDGGRAVIVLKLGEHARYPHVWCIRLFCSNGKVKGGGLALMAAALHAIKEDAQVSDKRVILLLANIYSEKQKYKDSAAAAYKMYGKSGFHNALDLRNTYTYREESALPMVAEAPILDDNLKHMMRVVDPARAEAAAGPAAAAPLDKAARNAAHKAAQSAAYKAGYESARKRAKGVAGDGDPLMGGPNGVEFLSGVVAYERTHPASAAAGPAEAAAAPLDKAAHSAGKKKRARSKNAKKHPASGKKKRARHAIRIRPLYTAGRRDDLDAEAEQLPWTPGYCCSRCGEHPVGARKGAAGAYVAASKLCWVLCDYCDNWDHAECAEEYMRISEFTVDHSDGPCYGADVETATDGTMVFRKKQDAVMYCCARDH